VAKRPFLNSTQILGRQTDDLNFPGLTFDVPWVPYSGRREMPINRTHKRTNGRYLEGGPWYAVYQTRERASSTCTTRWFDRFTYTGGFSTYNPFGEPSFDWIFGPDRMKAVMQNNFGYGVEALAALNPVQPDFTAAASLYELRELPGLLKDLTRGVMTAMEDFLKRGVVPPGVNPELWRRWLGKSPDVSSLSKTAQWHLALSFGWLPVLSDIRNFLKARKDLHKRLAQVIRDAERPVRRRRQLRKDVNEHWTYTYVHGSSYNPYMSPSLNAYAYADEGVARTVVTVNSIDNMWAMAKFRYFLPPGPRDEAWSRNMRRRIMGGRITPHALYSVLPWSWLVDYFVGVGDFIKATDDGVADLLICDYCYIMRNHEYVATVEAEQYMRGNGSGPVKVKSLYTYKAGCKSRTPGSLFGFRLKTDLTVRQAGILSALGFSRLP